MHRYILKSKAISVLSKTQCTFQKGILKKVRTTSVNEQGMTLIELLVSLSILAIVIALAAPSFVSAINNNRVASATNDLISSFTLARAEAIKRNGAVLIIKKNTTTDGSRNCGNADWACGHQIGVDLNADGDVDDTVGGVVELLRDVKGPHRSTDIDSASAALNEITYNGSGGVTAATEFTLDTNTATCEPDVVRKIRKITLSLSGSSALTTSTTDTCP